jgi:hypothetical protein
MNTLHGSRPAAALIFFSVLAAIGLVVMTMTQPGVGQVAPDADEDKADIERTDTPGVTKQASTLSFVGKIASIEDNEMTVLLPDKKEETFAIHDKTEIVLNGKPAVLSELRPTDAVKILCDVGHRDRADVIVVARADGVVEESATTTETLDTPGARRNGSQHQTQQSGNQMLQQGKLFVAPLAPNSAAAQAGLRPGDIILLVEADAALDADAALMGLQMQPMLNTPAIVLDPRALGTTGFAPGTVAPGVAVPGQFGGQSVITDGQQPPVPQEEALPGVNQPQTPQGNTNNRGAQNPRRGTTQNRVAPETQQPQER